MSSWWPSNRSLPPVTETVPEGTARSGSLMSRRMMLRGAVGLVGAATISTFPLHSRVQ